MKIRNYLQAAWLAAECLLPALAAQPAEVTKFQDAYETEIGSNRKTLGTIATAHYNAAIPIVKFLKEQGSKIDEFNAAFEKFMDEGVTDMEVRRRATRQREKDWHENKEQAAQDWKPNTGAKYLKVMKVLAELEKSRKKKETELNKMIMNSKVPLRDKEGRVRVGRAIAWNQAMRDNIVHPTGNTLNREYEVFKRLAQVLWYIAERDSSEGVALGKKIKQGAAGLEAELAKTKQLAERIEAYIDSLTSLTANEMMRHEYEQNADFNTIHKKHFPQQYESSGDWTGPIGMDNSHQGLGKTVFNEEQTPDILLQAEAWMREAEEAEQASYLATYNAAQPEDEWGFLKSEEPAAQNWRLNPHSHHNQPYQGEWSNGFQAPVAKPPKNPNQEAQNFKMEYEDPQAGVEDEPEVMEIIPSKSGGTNLKS